MALKRCMSVLLAVLLVLGCTGWVPVHSVESHPVNGDSAQSQPVTSEKEAAQHTVEEDLTQRCEDSGIFRFIDKETFQREGHVHRLTEEEALDTYVFQNRDGTKSVYYMGHDVKYVAPDGSIRDKDITLVSVADGYTMRDNEVQLLLPSQAADGIMVSHNDNSVRLIPQGGDGTAVLIDNSIIYENYYGRRTALRYTPALSGVKEEIILAAYTGMSSFSFLLQTGGLGVYENDGQYYLAENEDVEAAFYLGQIIVYDAVGCPSMGSMTVETLVSGQVYRLTVSADVDFLTAPTTVYPVTIDPTITITESAEGGVIEDAPVFSGYPNRNFGNYVFNTIGYTDANYGVGRTVVRLNGLLENETFSALGADYISNVTFYMKDGGSSSTTVKIHALTKISTWTESSITWSNTPLFSLEASASATMGGGAWTGFDITTLAKQWKTGAKNGQCGFIMIGAEENAKKIGALSCEYGTGDYWPYVVVTYSLDVTLNYYTKDVDEGRSFTLIATTESEGGTVTWESEHPAIATVDASGRVTAHLAGVTTITATHTDISGEIATASCTVYVTVTDGLYYIKNASSGLCLQATTDQAYIYEQKTDQITRLDQLWLITYVSANRRYLIQPLQDMNRALIANDLGYVAVGEAASETAFNAHWEITHNSFGYAIQYTGASNQTSQPVVSGMPGSQVYLGTWGSNMSCHWEFESTEGIFLRDTESQQAIQASTEKTIEIGETYTLADLGISYEYYGSMQGGVTWSPIDSGITTVSACEGAVTPINGGVSAIKVTATLNGVTYTAYYTLISILPLSGYELDYEPELWNYSPVMSKTNCYAYALNVQVKPTSGELWYMQPGEAAGYGDKWYTWELTEETVSLYASEDSDVLGFVFEPISKDSPCDTGCYKVALVMDTYGDYHWYRQNTDGTWSHKVAGTEATNLDSSNNIIYDPELADKNYTSKGGLDYSDSICFFQVSALNYLYTNENGSVIQATSAYSVEMVSSILDISAAVTIGMTQDAVIALLGAADCVLSETGQTVGYYSVAGELVIVTYECCDDHLVVASCEIVEG